MKIVEITHGSWLQCHNEHASAFANQKLHVDLSLTDIALSQIEDNKCCNTNTRLKQCCI